MIETITPHFDGPFYLRRHSDVAAAGTDPLLHYVRWGDGERRDPHPAFSSTAYAAAFPEIAASGQNLFAHHLRQTGSPVFPADADIDARVEMLALLAPLFDADFYRTSNPDVVEAGVDPLAHFIDHGQLEGRDPSPDFSLAAYLEANPDVAASGMNPLLHSARHGLKEGRKLRPDADPAEAERRLVAPYFNAAYYVAVNRDVAESGRDPLDHFITTGWREGRDPNPHFSTRFYVETNPDVDALGRNPFVHYLESGRREERDALPPLDHRIHALKTLTPLDHGPDDWGDAPNFDPAALADLLGSLRAPWVMVSVAHDDHDSSIGGIQLCVDREATVAAQRGVPYLAVFPIRMRPVLAQPSSDPLLGLRLDGRSLGRMRTSQLRTALATVVDDGVAFALVVHSLFGHSPERIGDIGDLASDAVYWLHDYGVLCPGNHLLRNRVSSCAAPPIGSTACRICVFGAERVRHVERIDALLSRVPFSFAAPSSFARDLILEKSSGRPIGPVAVVPHCRVVAGPTPREAPVPRRPGPVRVAYLGWPAPFKGWMTFLRFANEHAWDGRYEFLAFTASEMVPPWIVRHDVTTRGADPQAMVRALREAAVDVVLLWSTWTDAFSIAAHEAVAAGTVLVTSRQSGNIARVVEEHGAGHVLDDVDALKALFESDRLAAEVAQPRVRQMGSVRYSRMSFELLPDDMIDGDPAPSWQERAARWLAAVED